MIPLGREEHLRLVLEPAERLAVDDAVAVALIRGPDVVLVLVAVAAARLGALRGLRDEVCRTRSARASRGCSWRGDRHPERSRGSGGEGRASLATGVSRARASANRSGDSITALGITMPAPEPRALDRIEAIRLDVDEAERFVERHRRVHGRERIQAHRAEAAFPRDLDELVRRVLGRCRVRGTRDARTGASSRRSCHRARATPRSRRARRPSGRREAGRSRRAATRAPHRNSETRGRRRGLVRIRGTARGSRRGSRNSRW